MPAQILHSLHGTMALEAYAVKAEAMGGKTGRVSAAFMRRLLEDPHYPFFCLGCQGPDLFYHNQRTRPVSLEYGSLLHRRGYGDFMGAFIGACLGDRGTAGGPSAAAAYAVGFFMHPFLDRYLHPYIICRAGNGAGAAGAGAEAGAAGAGTGVAGAGTGAAGAARLHIFLERIIDELMLEKLKALRIEDWDQEKRLAAPAKEIPPELLAALALSLRQAYPERAGKDARLEQRLVNAFKDAGHFFHVTSPASTRGKDFGRAAFFPADGKRGLALTAFLYPKSITREIDFLNEGRSPWHHPCESEAVRKESVPDLFLAAVEEASKALFDSFSQEDDQGLGAGLSASVGNEGLSLVDGEGSRCLPRRFDPFPLEGILDEQYRLRLASASGI